jgi:hypothetical protein
MVKKHGTGHAEVIKEKAFGHPMFQQKTKCGRRLPTFDTQAAQETFIGKRIEANTRIPIRSKMPTAFLLYGTSSRIVRRVLQRLFDGVQQVRPVEWFIHEGDGAAFERSPAHFIVDVSGYKDDRQLGIVDSDPSLQFNAIHPRHSHIGDQTGGLGQFPGLQQGLPGREQKRHVSG